VGATILFFAGLAVIAVWWLSKHRIGSKPWLEQGAAGELPGTGVSSMPVEKIGLGVLLAALGSLFALFISAYLMRMQVFDWRPVPKPALLWINSGVLLLSSAALQWARGAAERRDRRGMRTGLFAAAAAALVFLAARRLGTAHRHRLLPHLQPGELLLLPDHRPARGAPDRRPRRPGRGHRERMARERSPAAAAEPRSLQHVLGLPPVDVAGVVRPVVADLEDAKAQSADRIHTPTGSR
jgi:hypothetical protein